MEGGRERGEWEKGDREGRGWWKRGGKGRGDGWEEREVLSYHSSPSTVSKTNYLGTG